MATDARRNTLVGIAAEAGVSVSAVSKVLNGRTDVAADTRARIAGLLRRHGYHVASRLGFGVVDLLIGHLHSPWAEELIRGTVEAAVEAEASVIVTIVDSAGEFTRWLESRIKDDVFIAKPLFIADYCDRALAMSRRT